MKKRTENFLSCVLSFFFVLILLGICMTAVSAEDWTEETIECITQDWGDKQTISAPDGNAYTYWMDSDGTFSALITSSDGVTWLYMDYIDHLDRNGNPVFVSGWIGIKNFPFTRGSRFYARVLQSQQEGWRTLWDNIDGNTRKRLNSQDSSILTVGVINPDGIEYVNLGDLTQLFIQDSFTFSIPSDTDDEITTCIKMLLPTDTIPAPESGQYTVFLLTHFGNTFFLNPSDNAFGSTLSEGSVTIICTVAAAIVFGVGGFLLGRRSKKKPVPTDREADDQKN